MKKIATPDPRCFECYYWRTLSGFSNKADYACHFCLDNGKTRDIQSDTECGSYEPKKAEGKRRGFETVPMTQWGCHGNVVDWLSQR